MLSHKEQSQELFSKLKNQRSQYKLSEKLDARLNYCEYMIQSYYTKNSKSKKTPKYQYKTEELSIEFRQAYKSLNIDEKLGYYVRHIEIIIDYINGKIMKPQRSIGLIFDYAYTRSFNLKIWRQKKLRLNKQQNILYAEYQKQIKAYNLVDYLIRLSKNTDYKSFVLQSINNNPQQRSQTIHIGFKQSQKFKLWYNQLVNLYKIIQWEFIISEMQAMQRRNRFLSPTIKNQSMKFSPSKGLHKNHSSHYYSDKKRNPSLQKQIEDKLSLSVIINKQKKSQVVVTQFDEHQSSEASYANLFSANNANLTFYSVANSNFEGEVELERQHKKNTIIQSIASIDLEEVEEIQENDSFPVEEQKDNIFHKLFPEYDLRQIQNTINFSVISCEENVKICQHIEKPQKLKVIINLNSTSLTLQNVLAAFTNPQFSQKINSQTQFSSIKTLIRSENSAMIYTKIKPYHKLYRARDFIFLRHVFRHSGKYFIADKSINNINYPPFTTIVRGDMTLIWSLSQVQSESSQYSFLLVCEATIHNNGYLNQSQNINLIIKYFQGYVGLQKKLLALNNFCAIFSHDWNIKISQEFLDSRFRPSSPSKKSIQRKTQTTIINKFKFQQQKAHKKFIEICNTPKKQKKISEVYANKNEQKQQINMKDMNNSQNYQITEEEVLQQQKQKEIYINSIKREYDDDGYVIISQDFVSTKYILQPLPKKQTVYLQLIGDHPIWRGDWNRDTPEGGIIFTNQKKIQEQKKVLSFILSNIGKNLLSGKSILNISLPVDIFSAQSNLQLLMYSLTYAPLKLQQVAKNVSTFQRFKTIVGFGVSNSPLYLNMQKPFNPILGETFQCFIDGCPGYAQQISHHPPIASVFFQGRGYRIVGQFQSKIELHLNSGCGTNDGVFRIQFQDGMQVCYITPGGEVSGISYGDRKFNMVGKSYYWIQNEGLFLELIFNPSQKGLFSMGKQERPVDYFEGTIVEAKPQFFKSFLSKKKGCPSEKQIIKKHGKVSGIWHKYVKYEEDIIINIDKQYPVKLQYEAVPLPSDANWREDIQYRRLMDISRSQLEKERLEVIQRKDRKLRQKNEKKKN